jgi:hypothetical protein
MAVLGASSLQINSATLGSQTGSAPMYACRAWVSFNGTTAPGTINNNGNVSSVTRNATGSYTVNFTTAMPHADYSYSVTSCDADETNIYNNGAATTNAAGYITASSLRYATEVSGSGPANTARSTASIFC